MIDNLPAHKAAGVREAIEARGAKLRYLPKYSPDLNPIEMPFSKLKGRPAQGGRTDNSASAPPDRSLSAPKERPRPLRAHTDRARSVKLFQPCRLCVKSTGICS